MPSAPAEPSDLKRQGRQRLIGAVALALVAAVVIPMVLDSEPRPVSRAASTAIPDRNTVAPLPPPEAPPAVAEARNAGVTPAEPPAPVADAPAASGPAAAPPAAASPLPAPVVTAAPAETKAAVVTPAPAVKAVETPSSVPARAAPPALAGFAAQVGAFRDESRLAQARKKLSSAGIRHYTERVSASGGDLTRLRAGPFPDRDAAVAAAAKMKAAGLDATVVSLP